MKVLTDKTAAGLVRLLRERSALPPRRVRIAHGGAPARNPDVCPAVVRSGGAVPGVYNVMLHPNGIGRPGGGLATVSMTEFGVEHDLPSGTIILAHAIAVAAAEDGED